MKRIVAVLLFLFAVNSYGAMNPELGVYGGGHFSRSGNLNNGAAFFGVLSLPVAPWLSLDVQGGQYMANTKPDALFGGRARVNSLEFVPKLRLPGRVSPYVSLGMGYFMPSNTIDFTQVAGFRSLGVVVAENISDTLGGVFGGGMDYSVSSNVSIGLDVAYLYVPTVNATLLTNSSTGNSVLGQEIKTNLDTVRVTGGFKVRFGGEDH